MERYQKTLQDAADELRLVDQMRRDIIKFGKSENLHAIAIWATASDWVDGQYGTEDGVIFREGPFLKRDGWPIKKGSRSQFNTRVQIPAPDGAFFDLLRRPSKAVAEAAIPAG